VSHLLQPLHRCGVLSLSLEVDDVRDHW
jgi:hypothetical protein